MIFQVAKTTTQYTMRCDTLHTTVVQMMYYWFNLEIFVL